MYILFSHKNLNFELENINSTRKTLLPKSEIDLNILSYNLFLYSKEDIYFGYWEEEKRAELLENQNLQKIRTS
ncbi:hypothetical protein LEP1GSC151_3884, partial [Leptospira interrogans serovar Grippotyphosa str. LT2186]